MKVYFKGALPQQYGFVFDQRALRLVDEWIHFHVLVLGLLRADWQHYFTDLNWCFLTTARFMRTGNFLGTAQFLWTAKVTYCWYPMKLLDGVVLL